MNAEMIAVESSNLAAVGWEQTGPEDGDGEPYGVLRVEFRNGKVYEYHDVNEDVFTELRDSSSVGKDFRRLVQDGGYAYDRAG